MNPTLFSGLYLVVILGIFVLIIFLPEKKRKKQFTEMLKSLKVNDEIVTRGGIIGKVITIDKEFVIIQSGPDKSRLKIQKIAINNIVNN